MGKPFNKSLAKWSTEKTRELVHVLNGHLKRFRSELGPGKNSDIIVVCKSNNKVKVFVEVEIVRRDRWRRILSEYLTVRWPLAKKEKCLEYLNREEMLILLSANEEKLSEVFYIDCKSWIELGHEERAPFVRAGGKPYRYRKGQEEPFWAIEKSAAKWNIEDLERFLLNLLKSKGLECN